MVISLYKGTWEIELFSSFHCFLNKIRIVLLREKKRGGIKAGNSVSPPHPSLYPCSTDHTVGMSMFHSSIISTKNYSLNLLRARHISMY